jgi:hypothetical protein
MMTDPHHCANADWLKLFWFGVGCIVIANILLGFALLGWLVTMVVWWP